MYLLLSQHLPLLVTVVILVIVGSILKKTWWERLGDD